MKRKCYMALILFAVSSSALMSSHTSVLAEETELSVALETDAGEEKADTEKDVPEDGLYTVEFHTDSSMFHVNEAHGGRGVLTVKDGKMTLHISLASKSIVNLFPGIAEDAKKEDAELLEPTTDNVTYSDGFSEEVYGFDIPIPELEEEFDLALIGKKGKWYDHKVSVDDLKPAAEEDLEKLVATVETEEEENN